MSWWSGGIAAIAILGGFAVVMLTVAAVVGRAQRPSPEVEETGVASRDGNNLVVTVGSPLPPRCVLCGDASSYRVPASALLRNLGAHPDAAAALTATRLPLCDAHARVQERFERNVAVAAATAFLVLLVNVAVLLAPGGHHSAVMLTPAALAFVAVFAYSVARRPGKLFVGRATLRHVRIAGVGRELLDSLPPLTDHVS